MILLCLQPATAQAALLQLEAEQDLNIADRAKAYWQMITAVKEVMQKPSVWEAEVRANPHGHATHEALKLDF